MGGRGVSFQAPQDALKRQRGDCRPRSLAGVLSFSITTKRPAQEEQKPLAAKPLTPSRGHAICQTRPSFANPLPSPRRRTRPLPQAVPACTARRGQRCFRDTYGTPVPAPHKNPCRKDPANSLAQVVVAGTRTRRGPVWEPGGTETLFPLTSPARSKTQGSLHSIPPKMNISHVLVSSQAPDSEPRVLQTVARTKLASLQTLFCSLHTFLFFSPGSHSSGHPWEGRPRTPNTHTCPSRF